MYVSFACKCGDSLEVESYQETEQEVWDMAKRFVESHQQCGFVRPAPDSKVMNLHFGTKNSDKSLD